jgi:hypothetical protein
VVDGARDAVVLLKVDLRKNVSLVDRGVGDVADGGSVDNVANNEALDGLVLRAAASAVEATHGVDVTPVLLVTTVVAALLSHGCGKLAGRKEKRGKRKKECMEQNVPKRTGGEGKGDPEY